MKAVIIGIHGRVGSRIARELLRRGHTVTGVSRNPDPAAAIEGVVTRLADANHVDELVPLLIGHDVVVSSSRFLTSDANVLLAALRLAKVNRLLVVGGAGSMLVEGGGQLIDTPEFLEKSKPESGAGVKFLNVLRGEQQIDWTFLSPSALFSPDGPRTGKFRLGGDLLLFDPEGRSWISMDDYAIAIADEVELHQHPRQRFTVGY